MDVLPFCQPEHHLRICYFVVAFRILWATFMKDIVVNVAEIQLEN